VSFTDVLYPEPKSIDRNILRWMQGSIAEREGLRRHEWWRLSYRSRRYLELVSDGELQEHGRDLINNLVTLTPQVKIGLRHDKVATDFFWPRFTHMLEEYGLRSGGSVPYDMMRNHSLPSLMWPRRGGYGRTEAKSWSGLLRPLPECAIVKYGKLEHLGPMFEGGHVRLWPASRYQDMRLDTHRRDDERSRRTVVHPRGMKVQLVQRADGTKVIDSPQVEPISNVTYLTECRDYYVWSASHSLEPRLFVDFEADACLIIHRPREFVKRFGWTLTQHFGRYHPPLERFNLEFHGVTYYDPYNLPEAPHRAWKESYAPWLIPTESGPCLNVPWIKQLRYAYQKEWRIVAEPTPARDGDLPELHLTLGSLFDVAEIVYVGEFDGRAMHTERTAIVPRMV